MRGAAIFAIALASAAIGGTRADSAELPDWYREARTIVESLLPGPGADRDVIEPPAGIDPRMAYVPSPPQGTMRIIRPPMPGERWH
jgi:hypothetical protein